MVVFCEGNSGAPDGLGMLSNELSGGDSGSCCKSAERPRCLAMDHCSDWYVARVTKPSARATRNVVLRGGRRDFRRDLKDGS